MQSQKTYYRQYVNEHETDVQDPHVRSAWEELTNSIARSDNDLARLLAIRNAAERLDSTGDVDWYDELVELACRICNVGIDCAEAVVRQGIEISRTGKFPPPILDGPTPQVVVDAVLYELEHGRPLDDLSLIARLRRCDSKSIKVICTRLEAMGWAEDRTNSVYKSWEKSRG